MITTPAMGLKRWDQPNDIFSYTELSDNFALLDAHDHTSGKGVQVPTGGIANLAITTPKIANDAIDASKIATDAVTATKIPNASIADTKLVTPALSAWRPYRLATSKWSSGALSASQFVSTGTDGVASTTYPGGHGFYFNPADYNVSGKTLRMRLRAWVLNGNYTPAGSWAVIFCPVLSWSAASNMASFGATTASVTLVAAGTPDVSTEINAPGVGWFTVGVQNASAGTGAFLVGWELQTRFI